MFGKKYTLRCKPDWLIQGRKCVEREAYERFERHMARVTMHYRHVLRQKLRRRMFRNAKKIVRCQGG